jgi:DNA repair protein RadC
MRDEGMSFPPDVIREVEAYAIKEHRELVYTHGPESADTKGLLWSVLYPIPKDRLDKLFLDYNIKQISLMTIPKLMGIGFSQTQATKIQSVFELARRLETFVDEPKRKICSPKDVYSFMYPKCREQKKEKFITLYLDTKNQILKEETISIGSLNASIVHPREVFKGALELSSASIIMIHNHPSGDPSPSREDIMVTEKLCEGGKLLGIDVLDHIIIGEGRYVSLKDEGFIH